MKPKQSKYKTVHTAAEKEYFKSIADQVRAARILATTKQSDRERTPSLKPTRAH